MDDPKALITRRDSNGKIISQYYKLFSNPPRDPSYEQLMEWLADTQWVNGRVRKIISSLDLPFIDDYIQEVWEQILIVPHEKIMEIWSRGKGKFCNYIKSIIQNNVVSVESRLYKHIREARVPEIYLDHVGWAVLDNDGIANYLEPEMQIKQCEYIYGAKYDATKTREWEFSTSQSSVSERPIDPGHFEFEDSTNPHHVPKETIQFIKINNNEESKKFKKSFGKSVRIECSKTIIDSNNRFLTRLLEMSQNDEVRTVDDRTIDYIINNLDDYDKSILLTYYNEGNKSATKTGRLIKLAPATVDARVKKIIKQIKTHFKAI